MNRREAGRRARLIAQHAILSGMTEWDLARWTDDGSEDEQAVLATALIELADGMLNRAPDGWAFTPRPPWQDG